MALVLADRVKETSGTTGTGDFSLAGATTGFQRFADTVGDGNTTYYAISLVGGGQFEVGRGTYIAATNSITRDEVFDSSNNGSLVSFTTGTKDVFVVYPSGRAVTVDGSTVNIPNSATVPVTSGGTGADNASTARSNLGLGSIATQDSNNVNLDGGSITGTDVDVSGATFTVANDQISGDAINGGTATPTALNVDSGTLFVDSTNNRVGVGTSSPDSIFHLQKSSVSKSWTPFFANTGLFERDGNSEINIVTDSTSTSAVMFSDEADQNVGSIRYVHSSDDFRFKNGGGNFIFDIGTGEAMRIDSSGNVGIGTSSPSSPLFVRSDRDLGSNTQNLNYATLEVESGTASVSLGQSNGTPAIFGYGAGTAFNLCLNPNDGNVGIGTSSPAEKLHTSGGNGPRFKITDTDNNGDVNLRSFLGNAFLLADDEIRFYPNNSEAMRVNSSGRVGIGTSSPAEKLDVSGKVRIFNAINPVLRFDNLANPDTHRTIVLDTFNEAFQVQLRDSNFNFIENPYQITFNANGGSNHRWRVQGSEAMRIDANGRVGIGTSNPETDLDVNGEIKSTGNPASLILQSTGATVNASRTYALMFNNDFSIQSRDSSGNFISNDYTIEKGNNGSIKHQWNIGSSEAMRIDSSGIVDILSGSVELNGNRLNGLEVTIADDAVAELTFPGRAGGGFIFIVQAGNNPFPQKRYNYSGYVDFGSSPGIQPPMASGNDIDSDTTNTLTGTTGTDGNVTIGVAGDSGTLYLENRTGSSKTFQITLL